MKLVDVYTGESGKLIKIHLQNVVYRLDRVTDIDRTLSNDKIAVSVLAKLESIDILRKELELTAPDEESDSLDNKVTNLKKKNGL